MTAPLIALASCAATLAASLLLPFAVRPLLIRLGVMDVPNERSSHSRPVLRGLGLAVLIALGIGGIIALVLSLPDAGQMQSTFLVVIVGALAAGLLGLREDLRGLSVPVRSALTLIIALVTSGSIVWITQPAGPAAFSAWQLLLVGYAVLFVSSYINVANFMDGLNGISGFHGVVAGLTFGAAGWLTATPWLLTVGLLLAAAFGGFLPWNLTKPGAFLGDVGSYLLGGAVAITSFSALVSGVPLLASIGPMVLYFGDVGVTLVKRMRAGYKWDEPHKEHTYQRIQQLGYSHVQSSLMVTGLTVLTSGLGLFSIFTNLIGTLVLLVGGLAVLVFYLALPRILPVRH